MSPALLMFTFVIGSGSVFVTTPAYQSLVPELVPREDVASAVQLNSINVNIARAVGPAIADLIAHFGVGADFAVNAGTFLVYAFVFVATLPEHHAHAAERFFPALRAGGRYVRHSPVVRRISVARHTVSHSGQCVVGTAPSHGESSPRAQSRADTGLLLGALGVGAIVGATVMAKVRAKLSANGIVRVSGGFFCVALVAVAFLHSTIADVVVPDAHRRDLGLDARDLEHVTAAFPAGLGPSPGPVGVSNGALRRAGFRCPFVGRARRRIRAHRGPVASAVFAAGTASTRLWPLLDASHGPITRRSSQSGIRIRRRIERRTGCGADDLFKFSRK